MLLSTGFKGEPQDPRFTDASKILRDIQFDSQTKVADRYCYKFLNQSCVYMGKKKKKKHQINSFFIFFFFFSTFLNDYRFIWGPDQDCYCSYAVKYVQN